MKLSEMNYSDFRDQFKSVEEFERDYGKLSEEEARALIRRSNSSPQVKACMYQTWKESSGMIGRNIENKNRDTYGKDIMKIVIKSSSGYGLSSEAYNDEFILTPNGIAYHYLPYDDTGIIPEQKWKYTSQSSSFREMYFHLAEMIPEILHPKLEMIADDAGSIEVIVTYADKTKESKTYWGMPEKMPELYREMLFLIPEAEEETRNILEYCIYEEEEENE